MCHKCKYRITHKLRISTFTLSVPRETPQNDEEDAEVDVVAVDTEAEIQVGPSGVVFAVEPDVSAPPRDKIRKSDTIWSPWK